jgi:hypothetical protein
VRSTRSGILFAERLPRDFAGEGLSSAIILKIKVKQLNTITLKRTACIFIATMMQLIS